MARQRKEQQQAKSYFLDIPCTWGNVNIGDETVRLGVRVSRENLSVTQADKNLCGKRLVAKAIARAGDGQSGQASLPGTEGADAEVEAAFDVRSIGVGTKNISFGLTAKIKSVDLGQLSGFANRGGMLHIESVAVIPAEDGGEDDGGDHDVDA